MLHELYIVFMQLLTNIGKITMQLPEIIRKVEAHMKSEIDRGIDAGFCKTFRPVLYLVHNFFLRPQQVIEGSPPTGCPTGYERSFHDCFHCYIIFVVPPLSIEISTGAF